MSCLIIGSLVSISHNWIEYLLISFYFLFFFFVIHYVENTTSLAIASFRAVSNCSSDLFINIFKLLLFSWRENCDKIYWNLFHLAMSVCIYVCICRYTIYMALIFLFINEVYLFLKIYILVPICYLHFKISLNFPVISTWQLIVFSTISNLHSDSKFIYFRSL